MCTGFSSEEKTEAIILYVGGRWLFLNICYDRIVTVAWAYSSDKSYSVSAILLITLVDFIVGVNKQNIFFIDNVFYKDFN